MDSETLLWLVLLAVYILFQFLGGRKRPPARPAPPQERDPRLGEPEPAAPRRREPSNDMDDALREIREALGMEPPAPEPPPRSEPQPAPAPRRQAAPADQEFRRPHVEPAAAPAQQPRAPQKTGVGGRTQKQRGAAIAKSVPVEIYTQEPGGRRKESALQQSVRGKLKERNALREAILLREILGPPRSRR